LLVIDGNFDQALKIVFELSDRYPITLVNSVNQDRIEGQTTAAYEICDALGHAPDALCLPVGNAGNITAYWRGFSRYYTAGRVSQRPQMLGFQAAGSAPIVHGAPVEHPETVATAIRIGNPASWSYATAARDESHGLIDAVTDEQILAAWRDLARIEGVFCEPASAAGVAGLRMLIDQGRASRDACYVAVLTGHGLKDPGLAVDQFAAPTPVPAEMDAIVHWLGL
jgi:threonine synthase